VLYAELEPDEMPEQEEAQEGDQDAVRDDLAGP
jgi:hypothetical protein